MYKFIQTTHGLVLAAVLLMSGMVSAAEEASIPFMGFGSIRDWQAEGDTALLVQDIRRNWYRATFWQPCRELPFAIRIGFVTDNFDRLDKFSSIRVDGERCWFKAFEKSAAPLPKPKKDKGKAAKPAEPDAKATDSDARPG